MKKEDLLTDEQLLKLIQSDDESAFRVLFKRHYKTSVGVIQFYLNDLHAAEDVAQNVFIKLWSKRGALGIQLSFAPYLCRMCINGALNYLSANKKMVFSEPEEWGAEIMDTSQAEAEARMINEQRETDLMNAVKALPEKCRVVFCLNRFEGLSHKEISEQLNISTKTIENHMTKGFKILRDILLQSPALFLLNFFQIFFID